MGGITRLTRLTNGTIFTPDLIRGPAFPASLSGTPDQVRGDEERETNAHPPHQRRRLLRPRLRRARSDRAPAQRRHLGLRPVSGTVWRRPFSHPVAPRARPPARRAALVLHRPPDRSAERLVGKE